MTTTNPAGVQAMYLALALTFAAIAYATAYAADARSSR